MFHDWFDSWAQHVASVHEVNTPRNFAGVTHLNWGRPTVNSNQAVLSAVDVYGGTANFKGGMSQRLTLSGGAASFGSEMAGEILVAGGATVDPHASQCSHASLISGRWTILGSGNVNLLGGLLTSIGSRRVEVNRPTDASHHRSAGSSAGSMFRESQIAGGCPQHGSMATQVAPVACLKTSNLD